MKILKIKILFLFVIFAILGNIVIGDSKSSCRQTGYCSTNNHRPGKQVNELEIQRKYAKFESLKTKYEEIYGNEAETSLSARQITEKFAAFCVEENKMLNVYFPNDKDQQLGVLIRDLYICDHDMTEKGRQKLRDLEQNLFPILKKECDESWEDGNLLKSTLNCPALMTLGKWKPKNDLVIQKYTDFRKVYDEVFKDNEFAKFLFEQYSVFFANREIRRMQKYGFCDEKPDIILKVDIISDSEFEGYQVLRPFLRDNGFCGPEVKELSEKTLQQVLKNLRKKLYPS